MRIAALAAHGLPSQSTFSPVMSLIRPKSWLNIDAHSSAVTKPGMA